MIVILGMSSGVLAKTSLPSCSCKKPRLISLQYPPMKGNDIRELQRELKKLGFYHKQLNSKYDWHTYLAVKRFKYKYNLPNNDVVNRQTWFTLGQALAKVKQTQTTEKELKPPKGTVSILINTDKRNLKIFSDDKLYHTFPVAVGKYSTRSSVGEWEIIRKKEMWEKGPFGSRWMRLNVPWGSYGIHGTNKPGSIEAAVSQGCIRMYNQDVKLLYSWVEIGTQVKIVGTRDPIVIKSNIKPGQVGREVVLLQEKLREHGFNPGYTDGRFGEDTKQAMKELKYLYGLQDDLIADKNTFYILNTPLNIPIR